MYGTQKRLPIGVDFFENLREQDYYYVDKTLLIKRIVTDAGADLYWDNSSSNQLVRHFIDLADSAKKNDIERLIAGETLERRLVMNLTYDELDKKELLWSVLYQTGYLTLDKNSRSEQRGYARQSRNREKNTGSRKRAVKRVLSTAFYVGKAVSGRDLLLPPAAHHLYDHVHPPAFLRVHVFL